MPHPLGKGGSWGILLVKQQYRRSSAWARRRGPGNKAEEIIRLEIYFLDLHLDLLVIPEGGLDFLTWPDDQAMEGPVRGS